MRLRLLLIALLGVAVAAYLIFNIGFSAVFSAVLRIGWAGFALTCLYALALYVGLGVAWYVLVPGLTSNRLRTFVWGRIVRDSAAEVLPFSQVGGFVIGARATILNGVAAPLAFASTIVDVSAEMMAQIGYVALGLVILRERAPHTPLNISLINTLLIGLVVGALAGGTFIFAQNKGTWITDKLADRFLPKAIAHAAAVAESLRAIYRRPWRVGFSVVLHFGGWIGSAIVTLIAALLIGAAVDLPGMIALDSLVFAIRATGFVVPNALGVQEAAYALLGPLLGVPPEMALAVSLLRRARDIAIGIPALLIWQGLEGSRAVADSRSDGESLQN
jgi:glycosyltransferase 2 family protein